ncbi:MAG TPA: hypothetical protein VHJ20_18220 [Polyangia bacterium]|nr:hypothetical protein [Polyangia bacterium]
MSLSVRSLSSRRFWALALVVLGAACASHPAPAPQSAPAVAGAAAALSPVAASAPRLVEASEVHGLALATVSVTSIDRFILNGAKLIAPAVPLPIDPAGVRDMMLAQSGLPPEVAQDVDFGAPMGAAVVPVPNGAGMAVFAIAARGPAEAARVVAALGKQVEVRGPFALIEGGAGGKLWLWRDGAVLVFSSSLEALARGARLAEEARRPAADDITAILHPDAIARANGTDVKTAIAQAVEQLKAQAANQPGQPPLNDRALASITEMFSLVGDADSIELGAAADPDKGLSLRVRMIARTASGLEKIAREAHPYELDPGLLVATKTPSLVGAWSMGSFMRTQMMHQRDALQTSKLKGATGALAFVDAMIAGLAGQTSFTFGVAKESPLFEGALGYPLKDAAAAAAIAGSLDRLDKDAAVALLDAQMGASPFLEWTFKKENVGKLKAAHYTAKFKTDLGLDPAVSKKLFGGKGIDIYMAVSGTRLLTTFGHDAKANLGRVAAAKADAGKPDAGLTATLAATKGRDGFFHFDVAPILGLVSTFAKTKDPRTEALGRANAGPIPIYGSSGGDGVGRVVSFDMTLPPLAFKNAGAVVRAAMSGAAGAPSENEKPAKKPKKK